MVAIEPGAGISVAMRRSLVSTLGTERGTSEYSRGTFLLYEGGGEMDRKMPHRRFVTFLLENYRAGDIVLL